VDEELVKVFTELLFACFTSKVEEPVAIFVINETIVVDTEYLGLDDMVRVHIELLSELTLILNILCACYMYDICLCFLCY